MKFCQRHWDQCREVVDQRGLTSLVSADGEEVVRRQLGELLEGNLDTQESFDPLFDPLMSMHWHWMNAALENGGLYLLGADGPHDGHYCPACEFEKHSDGFNFVAEAGRVADQMVAWARTEKLIPGVS